MINTMIAFMVAASSESINTSITGGTVDRTALTGICVGMDTSAASLTNHFKHAGPIRALQETRTMPTAPHVPRCSCGESQASGMGSGSRRLIRGRGDERHQAAAPAIADHVGHGHCRVADPAREKFGQERTDWPVHHSHVRYEDGDDKD